MENQNEKMPIKSDLKDISSEALANLATAEPIMNLVKQYAKFEEAKPVRFVTAGITEFIKEEIEKSTGEITTTVMPAINLIDKDKNIFITASNMIVNACKDLPKFTGVEIELTGNQKLSGGKKLNLFKVTLLNA